MFGSVGCTCTTLLLCSLITCSHTPVSAGRRNTPTAPGSLSLRPTVPATLAYRFAWLAMSAPPVFGTSGYARCAGVDSGGAWPPADRKASEECAMPTVSADRLMDISKALLQAAGASAD